MDAKKIIITACITMLCISQVYCADFFESLLVRLHCYRDRQRGCNRDFVDAYPELRWSVTNLTKATTHFYMFSKGNPEVPELMHKCAGELPPRTKFNPKCRTEIFLPGYFSGICNYAIFRELKNERLKYGCYNVLLVDYMWGNIPDLEVAKKNLKIVSKQTVVVIRKLKEKYNLTADDFILTGHSYGAHLAGYIGQEEPIGIINGIEPAGVLFTENSDLDDRLDAKDAKCVHVTHCNAGQCLPGYFGVNFTSGTDDFWFNGGLYQINCFLQGLKAFLKGDIVYGILNLYPAACSHFQCLQYYRNSMNPNNCQFVGIQCESDAAFQAGKCRDCGRNGENCLVTGAYTCDCKENEGSNRNYYLNTAFKCPYCDNSKINTNGLSCPAQFN